MLESIAQYVSLIPFLIPIGIIGIWRWSVWLIRKIGGLFYRMPKGAYSATLAVITPVYNEDPEVFRQALSSWAENDPDEIIAVIDHSDGSSISVFKEFQGYFPDAELIVTNKPGKRPALADGIRASKSELVALVDSDTIWSPNIKRAILGPFSNLRVGGLALRQDVLKTDTLARRLFKIHLDIRYLFEFPFLGAVETALLCLSGRTAVYRREAVIDKLDRLVNEKFWGKKMISGDDKTLTHLVQAAGWETRFLRDVRVYTPGTRGISDYLKQQLRWTRNGLRSDFKALTSRWLWRDHKILALHMLDKFIQPITLILSPIYFAAALYFGFPEVAAVIVAWWIVSRAVKLYPHLKEKPLDVFLLPVYILFSFVMAFVKIFALMTIDEQGWITRWDKRRLVGHYFHNLVSFAATVSIVVGLTFVVFNFKSDAVMRTQLARQQAEKSTLAFPWTAPSILTPDLARPSEAELAKIETELSDAQKSDPYGYYAVRLGDTVPILRKRYNLPATGRILDGQTKLPIGNFTPLAVGRQLAISVEDLRHPNTTALLAFNPAVKPPRVTFDAPSNTIFVAQGGSVATLTRISRALGFANRRLLEQTAPGEWILRANLYIGKNVTLVVSDADVKHLKLKSDDKGFVWLRSETGSMLFSNTKVTSWDESAGAPDFNHENGRAHVTARNSGRMDILNSEMGYLGFVGAPERGGPFGGSYGVSWKINNDGFRSRLLTGVVADSKFHDNYFGLYTFGATGMIFRNNEAYNNIEYGFDPHDDSNNFLIEGNKAYHNGNHGIILSRRCFNNTIINNQSFDNRLHGIMLDRESNNNLVQSNTVYGNTDGIAIYGSNGNLVLENDIHNNVRGIRLNAGSAGNYFTKNILQSNGRGIYIYDQAHGNILVGNRVAGSDVGITIKNASDNILLSNFNPSENKKDGNIASDAYGNNIQ